MVSFFKLSSGYASRWKVVWQIAALLVACNYFAFRTELFSEEYEQNHPPCDPFTHEVSVTVPSLTWETFDKDNAPKAFSIQASTHIIFISFVICPPQVQDISSDPQQPVRDKSPPVVFL